MGTGIGKSVTLLLILIIAASSTIAIRPASSVSKLSVPEFTVTYADQSYDIPASTTTDPYNGKTVEVPMQHIENKTLKFTIKNQAVNFGQLSYIIRMKGHFSDNWSTIARASVDKDSEFTVVLCTSSGDGRFHHSGDSFVGPSAGEADFQVKAEVWGEVMAERTAENPFGGSISTMFAESDWSNTQTITVAGDSGLLALFYGLGWEKVVIIVLVAIVAVLLVVVGVLLRRRGAK